jgi:hypothetical protein
MSRSRTILIAAVFTFALGALAACQQTAGKGGYKHGRSSDGFLSQGNYTP